MFLIQCNVFGLICCLSTIIFSLENGIIKTDRVSDVMKQVDRRHFCKHNAYYDAPQGIGYAATISAPHMVCSF